MPSRLANAIYNSSFADYISGGNLDRAFSRAAEAREMFESLGDRLGAARCLWELGGVLGMKGDYVSGLEYTEQSLAAFRGSGDMFGLGWSLHQVAQGATHIGKLDRAKEALAEALNVFSDAGDLSAFAILYGDAADLAIAMGETRKAAVLTAASLELGRKTGAALAGNLSLDRLDPAAPLSPEDLAQATREGQAMSLEQVTALAMELTAA